MLRLSTHSAHRRRPRPAVGATVGLLCALATLGVPGVFAAAGHPAAAAADGANARTFPAPPQRTAVHFTAPHQRAPVAASADPSPGASPAPVADSASTVDDLEDPATGLGPDTAARIPDGATQVLVASGASDEATRTDLSLWEHTDGVWSRTATMTGRNGANGWREDRREGDRTSPAGVFSLSDAGGHLADPGSLLPYHQDDGLRAGARAVYGDDYASVFDYVIAIDYNRRTGVAPTDDTRPMGWDAGGKIWLHVDHGSPTRGCVALPAEDMELLLTTLDPDRSPHIAMGSEEYLAQ